MDRLARVGSVRRGIMDDSHLRSSDLSYLISLRSAYVSLRQENRCVVQPYNPHRFSRQFGFVQNVPGRLKEKAQSESLQAVYMHWESCTRAFTNAYITLPAKDEFRGNPVTRVYAHWWSKAVFATPMQLVPFDCVSATPLQDRPVALVRQRLCSSPHHLDASEEAGDEVDSYEDGLVLRQRQQVLNKRPLEVAQVDSDVNFRHKKKEVFRPPQSDGRVSLEKDVGPSCPFDLAAAGVHSYMDMLLGGNLLTDGEIGDPPGQFYDEVVPSVEEFLIRTAEDYLQAAAICLGHTISFSKRPQDDVNFIRPGVFKVASKMAVGESFSLAIPVLANIYDGLNVISNLASTEDRAAVLPPTTMLKEKAHQNPCKPCICIGSSCTRAFTNAYITLPAKDEFRGNPVTRVYARIGGQRYIMRIWGWQVRRVTRLIRMKMDLFCGSANKFLNKRPLEVAQVDSDVNFRHKKKEVFRPPQSDGRVSLEKDVGPSCPFDLAAAGVHSYMDMLLGGNLLTDGEIGDPPGEELVQNSPNLPSLPCVGEGVQESIIRPAPLPASSAISLRGPNLNGTEQFIHRLKLRAALDVKSHIESRISKCSLEDLSLLEEDLSKLVSTIDNLNVDSSSLRNKIAELMAASTEYSSLHAISLKKLSPDDRAQQLAAIDLSLARVRSSQQVASGDYQVTEAYLASVQVRLDALVREREQLGTQASQLENSCRTEGYTFSAP
nr:uncharacterized protein LOC114819804 [Malus domestica]